MAVEIDTKKFGQLLALTREAFRTDPSYAIAVAGQASSLQLRRKSTPSIESSEEDSFPEAKAV